MDIKAHGGEECFERKQVSEDFYGSLYSKSGLEI